MRISEGNQSIDAVAVMNQWRCYFQPHSRLVPLLAGAFACRFNPNWEVGVEAAGMILSDDEQIDITVRATRYVNYHWALSAGYE